MANTGTVVLIAAMMGALGVCLVGIIAMARGGNFNKKYGNKLMRARILLQLLALVVFAVIMMAVGRA